MSPAVVQRLQDRSAAFARDDQATFAQPKATPIGVASPPRPWTRPTRARPAAPPQTAND